MTAHPGKEREDERAVRRRRNTTPLLLRQLVAQSSARGGSGDGFLRPPRGKDKFLARPSSTACFPSHPGRPCRGGGRTTPRPPPRQGPPGRSDRLTVGAPRGGGEVGEYAPRAPLPSRNAGSREGLTHQGKTSG